MTRKSLILATVTIGSISCQTSPPAPYPEWAKPDSQYSPSKESSNAFDGYVLAADYIRNVASPEINRISFPSGTNPKLLGKILPGLRMVASAQRFKCNFEYRAMNPFVPDPNASAWRLIGRGFVWKVQTALAGKNFTIAVHDYLVATRFGYDLMGGDVQTATLGISIINESRKAIAPYYRQFSSKDLFTLYAGLTTQITKFEGRKSAIENEQARMLLGIQFIQDAKQKNDYKLLQTTFGRDAKQAIAYLKNLTDDKRSAYFESIAKETREFVDYWTQNIDKPMAERDTWKESPESKVWIKLTKPFAAGVPSFATMSDFAICQTKIFAISAYALANSKSNKVAPISLKSVNPKVSLDPFSGKHLIYSSSGPEFKVYSIGQDLTDDGGESDESDQEPDVGIETDSN